MGERDGKKNQQSLREAPIPDEEYCGCPPKRADVP
jgi:hypothetical protein